MQKKTPAIITYFKKQPRSLFLLDASGAFLTALLLLAVLTPFNEYFGFPTLVLKLLAIIAICFLLYSLTCYAVNPQNWRLSLRIIAVANMLYCLLTIGFVLYHLPQITGLGISYFTGECIIVGILVFVEVKTAIVEKTS